MAKEVVITGMGVVAPAGIGVAQFWEGVSSGRSFITPISRFDTERFSSKMAGSIADFCAEDMLDPRIIVQTDRWTHFDLVCAQQALADALLNIKQEDPARIGAVFSAGTGGNGIGQQQLHICSSQGPQFVSAYLSIAWFYAASIGQVSIHNGFQGYGRNICAEAAGGLIALAHAAKLIQQEICDVVIVGGSEAPLVPYTFASHQASRLLSPDISPYPYRPFDATRTGIIVGEGGAAFCLESKERALRRDAPLHAEIAGWGYTFDGVVTREPAGDGKEYARAISMALAQARLQTEQIDWMVCDGLGTREGDTSEVRALERVFGEQLSMLPASAPKSMIGRLFNGASTTDVLMAILGMEHQTILPTVGYATPDPTCLIDCVPNEARSQSLSHVLVGARGFGGFNAALILRKPCMKAS